MIACLISFAAPFWLKQEGMLTRELHQGLWGECRAVKDKDCDWFWEDDYKWERSRPIFWKATQGLFSFGAATLIISFFLVSANMCCRCCDYYCINRTLCGLLLMAFLEMAVALALFCGYAYETMSARLTGTHVFDWGFWIGICAAGLDLLAVIVFFMNTCCRATD
jgi:hypothetical protein